MYTSPQQVTFHQSNTVNHMAAGGGHILLKTTENNVFSCGWNSKGQLGNGTTNNLSLLQAISNKHFDNKLISSLHCGWEESAMICDDGSLYVWGSNLYGQLGQPKDRKIIATPTELLLPNNEKATSISFSFRCSIILSSCGRAYALGQLRHFDDLKKSEIYEEIIHQDIKFVKFSENIEKLSCGQNHCVFVRPDNSVSGFGIDRRLLMVM